MSLQQADEASAAVAVAPRVTLADLQASITDEFYFTAAQGVAGAYPIPAHSIDLPQSLGLLTICVLVMRNGFTITGESAAASPQNFSADLGKQFAREAAIRKAWGFEGYLLRERLSSGQNG